MRIECCLRPQIKHSLGSSNDEVSLHSRRGMLRVPGEMDGASRNCVELWHGLNSGLMGGNLQKSARGSLRRYGLLNRRDCRRQTPTNRDSAARSVLACAYPVPGLPLPPVSEPDAGAAVRATVRRHPVRLQRVAGRADPKRPAVRGRRSGKAGNFPVRFREAVHATEGEGRQRVAAGAVVRHRPRFGRVSFGNRFRAFFPAAPGRPAREAGRVSPVQGQGPDPGSRLRSPRA